MKLLNVRSAVILATLTIAVGIFAAVIYVNFQTLQRSNLVEEELTSSEAVGNDEFSGALVGLKEEYFDDLVPVGGEVDPETGKFKGEVFDSECPVKSKPSPIVHPIYLNTERIEMRPVKRTEIKSYLSPSLIDSIYKDYGETLGGFFLSRGEMIVSIEEADVDKDGEPEKLVTITTGGNHPPHVGAVVDGNFIVAYVKFISGYIEPAKDGNGFYVKDPFSTERTVPSYLYPLCCPKGHRVYRVVFENGQFVPVWEQDFYYLRFEESE